jgi:hypothetical protein
MSAWAIGLSIVTALAFTAAAAANAFDLGGTAKNFATLVRFRAGWSHLAPALGFGLLLIAESVSAGWFI